MGASQEPLRHISFALPRIETSLKARRGRFAMVRRVGRDIRTYRDDPGGRSVRAGFRALACRALITAAYWFTASTSFANPAVAIARSLTSTFSGIRPIDLPGLIVAQLLGAICGVFWRDG